MSNVVNMYGGRPGPSTVPDHANTILSLFDEKKVVTFRDMQKATKRTWVRRFFDEAKHKKPNIVAIKKGRKLLGFTIKSAGRLPSDKISGESLGIKGEVKLVAQEHSKRAAKKVKRGRPAQTTTE